MSDIRQKIIFDDSDAIRSLTTQAELLDKLNQAIKAEEASYKSLAATAQKQVDELNASTQKATEVIGEKVIATAKARNESRQWSGALKGLANEINVMGVNLGRTVDQLKSKATAMRSAVTGINAGTNALRIFKVALISTGIGALIVALGSLVAFFTKTERGAEKLERVMAGVGAVISVITDRMSALGETAFKFGEALGKLLKGDVKGAAESAAAAVNGVKAAFTGIGEEIKNEVKTMVELKKREQDLEDARRAHRVKRAEDLKHLKELQLIADDNTKSAKQREAAATEAFNLEKKRNEESLAFDKEELDIAEKKVELGEARDSDLDNIAEIKERIATSEAESLTTQRKLQSQLQGIQAEQAAKDLERLEIVRELNEELNQSVSLISDALTKARLESLSPTERLLAENDLVKKQIELMFKTLDERAKAAGKEVDMSEEKAELLRLVEEKLAKDITKIRKEELAEDERIRKEYAKEREEFEKKQSQKRIDALGKEMMEGAMRQKEIADNWKNGIETVLDSVKVKLLDVFDLGGENAGKQLDVILKSFASSFDSLRDIFTANTEEAIARNEELIDSIRERAEALDDELEKELERQELGLANNVDAKRREIEAIKKEQAAAEKESEKLRKKQLAAQLLSDAVAQGSNIVTMASNILASPGVSLLGPAGIPVALAVIAAMLGIFSKIKASQKKLFTGGSLDQEGIAGFVNLSGRTDRHGARGHRVEDSNLILGGKEFVVAEGPAHEHADFLQALNSGAYAGKDLMREAGRRGLEFAMNINRDAQHNQSIFNELTVRRAEQNALMQASSFKDAVREEIGRLINVIESKPDTYSYSPGDVVVRETKDSKKITQTEKPWQWKPERS